VNFYNSYGGLPYDRCGLKKCYMYMRYSSLYKNIDAIMKLSTHTLNQGLTDITPLLVVMNTKINKHNKTNTIKYIKYINRNIIGQPCIRMCLQTELSTELYVQLVSFKHRRV